MCKMFELLTPLWCFPVPLLWCFFACVWQQLVTLQEVTCFQSAVCALDQLLQKTLVLTFNNCSSPRIQPGSRTLMLGAVDGYKRIRSQVKDLSIKANKWLKKVDCTQRSPTPCLVRSEVTCGRSKHKSCGFSWYQQQLKGDWANSLIL